MKHVPALIFLNGYYDARHLDFYSQEIEVGVSQGSPLICADGGLRIFHQLNRHSGGAAYRPDVLIGDLDSVNELDTAIAKYTVREWVGHTDKAWTDGQLAVAYALENFACGHLVIYGGLPRPAAYETDQFLGNLKLMRFGHHKLQQCDEGARLQRAPTEKKLYTAEMRDARQTIHYVISEVRLTRKNSRLQRVSLIAEEPNVVVAESQNLRWKLDSLKIDPDLTNALRNEFVETANWASIRLREGSPPVYVIHNWYG